jgi:hypothetical protein
MCLAPSRRTKRNLAPWVTQVFWNFGELVLEFFHAFTKRWEDLLERLCV